MSFRLATCPSGDAAQCVADKLILAFCILILIPIVYLMLVACKIKRVTSRLKFWLVLGLALMESILVIFHYAFIPYDSGAVRYFDLTQHVLKYVTIFVMTWVLLYDTVRIVSSPAMTCWFSFVVFLTLILFALIIVQYTVAETMYCHSSVWIMMRIVMIAIGISLIIVGIFVTFKFQEVLPTLKGRAWANARKTNIKIWTILSPAVYGSIVEGTMDIYLYGRQPADCYALFHSSAANAIFFFVLRIVGVNAWIWPILFVFNSRDVVMMQDLDEEAEEEVREAMLRNDEQKPKQQVSTSLNDTR